MGRMLGEGWSDIVPTLRRLVERDINDEEASGSVKRKCERRRQREKEDADTTECESRILNQDLDTFKASRSL